MIEIVVNPGVVSVISGLLMQCLVFNQRHHVIEYAPPTLRSDFACFISRLTWRNIVFQFLFRLRYLRCDHSRRRPVFAPGGVGDARVGRETVSVPRRRVDGADGLRPPGREQPRRGEPWRGAPRLNTNAEIHGGFRTGERSTNDSTATNASTSKC
jgi:hypothetical protein